MSVVRLELFQNVVYLLYLHFGTLSTNGGICLAIFGLLSVPDHAINQYFGDNHRICTGYSVGARSTASRAPQFRARCCNSVSFGMRYVSFMGDFYEIRSTGRKIYQFSNF